MKPISFYSDGVAFNWFGFVIRSHRVRDRGFGVWLSCNGQRFHTSLRIALWWTWDFEFWKPGREYLQRLLTRYE